MLGLGTSIDRSAFVGEAGPEPLFFSSVIPADFFQQYSVEGTLSLTANQSAPDGSTGWLKGAFNQDQVGFSGITTDSSNPFAIVSGQDYKISFKIFLSDGAGQWPSGPTTTQASVGDAAFSQEITAGEVALFSQTSTAASTNNVLFVYWYLPAEDRPNAGAQFYIKDFKVEDA